MIQGTGTILEPSGKGFKSYGEVETNMPDDIADDTIRADQAIRAKNEDVSFSGTYYWTFRLFTPSHFHLNIYITMSLTR